MLMFHDDVKQGLVLKMTFNDSESTLSMIQSRLFQWFRVDSFNDSESTRFNDSESTRFNDSASTRFRDSASTRFSDSASTRFSDSASTRFNDSESTRFRDSASTRFRDSASTRFRDSASTRFSDSGSTRSSDLESTRSVIWSRLVSVIQSRLFLLRDDNFIHGALSDLTHCRCFHSLTAVLHTKIHNGGTLTTWLWLWSVCSAWFKCLFFLFCRGCCPPKPKPALPVEQ